MLGASILGQVYDDIRDWVIIIYNRTFIVIFASSHFLCCLFSEALTVIILLCLAEIKDKENPNWSFLG